MSCQREKLTKKRKTGNFICQKCKVVAAKKKRLCAPQKIKPK